jgi:hypothetical protein
MNTGDKNTKGRVIFKGPKGGLYVIGPSGTKLRTFTKATAVAPAPTGPSSALAAAIAHVRTLKTMKARREYIQSRVRNFSSPNFETLARHVKEMNNADRAKRAAKKAGVVVAVSPRLTTAERNVRLAAIRARLNAMRAAKLAAIPTRRANVHKRLKNAVARVRARLRGNNPTTSRMTIPFCHSLASVPRKACTIRKAVISVYNSPMVNDGTVVATRANDIDLDWFKRQDAYVKNLSDYDFWTAQAHTNRSHSWIGPFLYRGAVPIYIPDTMGKHIVPLWPQIRKMILDGTFNSDGRYLWVDQFKNLSSEVERYNLYKSNTSNIPRLVMRRALGMYSDDLKRIIAGAPKSRKKMVLYRGASFDIFRSTVGHWHKLESFCSASYDLNHALGYEGGTMQRITVLPGTPVLLVAGMNQWNAAGEYEIMVNVGTKYLIRQRAVKRILWAGFRRITRVTDVTIAK